MDLHFKQDKNTTKLIICQQNRAILQIALFVTPIRISERLESSYRQTHIKATLFSKTEYNSAKHLDDLEESL
jgi:hypothetical protein